MAKPPDIACLNLTGRARGSNRNRRFLAAALSVSYLCTGDKTFSGMQRFISFLQTRLSSGYTPGEIRTLTHWIMERVCGYTPAQLLLHKNSILSESSRRKAEEIVLRLERGEPIQYVLGEGIFLGRTFRVAPGVLIPRPETEELVELMLAETASGQRLRLLDVGTGSGCIAVSLAKALPEAEVEAWDVSERALEIARENARLHRVSVCFRRLDVLTFDPGGRGDSLFDGIVSNPPYVRRREMGVMAPQVLDHEPHEALFVPDDDPLLFYRAIGGIARKLLVPGGALWFEINADLGNETAALLGSFGFAGIRILRDLSGKERFVTARCPTRSCI